VVGVQMRKKHLVGILVRDHQGGNISHRAGADIKQEFFAVSGFDQKAGSRLASARSR